MSVRYLTISGPQNFSREALQPAVTSKNNHPRLL